ncbi:hypothetical protein L5B97_00325 [Avibacterium sp. 20-15]|uniref:hypothetical protein n=1 Tax=unclassified Avibacterium TaxID=2685287 RepID=UPI00202668ED|nr:MULTISPECIES: hypothetical protein [unclassified Avibacterium]MCW9731947.1 hypothetical protein [Avibacterium sp. 20-15]URL04136.1 hypothetical protein L4F93_11405 [Avibacterium sp. 20-132]
MKQVTISKSEYDHLLTQAKRISFLEHYKPTIHNDGPQGTYEMVFGEGGLIDTIRYGNLIDCIDGALQDIREMQQAFWIYEESEIYAGRTIQEIVEEFFAEQEQKEILKDNLYGPVDLNQKFPVREDITSIAVEMTIKELLDEMVVFPNVVLSCYS